MIDFPTEDQFKQYLNTPFRLQVNAPKPIDLMLVGTESRPSDSTEEQGMERFSIFFLGSPEFLLPQATYRLIHPEIGELDVFLVAIGKEADGYRYEAVYNYYKSSAQQANS